MNRGKRRGVVVVALLLCLGALPAMTDPIREDDRGPVRDLQRIPPPGLIEGPAPLPHPEVPISPLSIKIVQGEPQLVGFTHDRLAANRGVLSFTRACHQMWPGSRMCTLSEINRTSLAPSPPTGEDRAWVNVEAAPDVLFDVGAAGSAGKAHELSNCRGWNSTSDRDFGLSIGLREDYGSCLASRCEERLVVACCAVLEEDDRI
ncbi:MAG: hypothetical protein GY716_05465 [bacterium]|nr:hypothetical protein [bacterium]